MRLPYNTCSLGATLFFRSATTVVSFVFRRHMSVLDPARVFLFRIAGVHTHHVPTGASRGDVGERN